MTYAVMGAPASLAGQSMDTYANDLTELVEELELTDAILVGIVLVRVVVV